MEPGASFKEIFVFSLQNEGRPLKCFKEGVDMNMIRLYVVRNHSGFHFTNAQKEYTP